MTHSVASFLTQLRLSPRSIGAVMPSSRALAEEMVLPLKFKDGLQVVELGPGTGPITALLYKSLRSRKNYKGIEINNLFNEALIKKYPDFTFANDSAENLADILEGHDLQQVDAIVCSLPWASLPLAVQETIMKQVVRCLKPGGIFVSFAYLQGQIFPGAWKFRETLQKSFSTVHKGRIVWNNVPPAFVFTCRK